MKIFPFPTKSLQLSKYPLADSTKKVFPNCCIKRNIELCHLRTHITKKFLRMLLPRFYRKIFLFPTISLKQSKYPHTDSKKTVFQNCSRKSYVQLCQLNAHIPTKFLKMLLAGFYVKTFPFPMKSLELSIYPLTDSTKRLFPNCCIKRQVELS